MKRLLFSFLRSTSSAAAFGLLFASTGCASTLAQPFEQMKAEPITIYRLQNYEPPQAAATGLVPAVPPQIQQWLTAGAQLLPPGLLPPGLIPGTSTTPAASDVPRFHNFRVLGSMAIADKSQRDEVLDLFGHDSNFQAPSQSCMYAEFGFRFGYGPTPGAPAGTAPAGAPPGDILVSLSCDQVTMMNYGWPYGAKNGLTPDSSKRIIAIVRKAFGG